MSIFQLLIFYLYVAIFQQHLQIDMRYSRACASYQDYRDIVLLLTRKTQIKGFLVLKLKPLLFVSSGSFRSFVSQVTADISCLTQSQTQPSFPVHQLSSIMTFQRICIMNNTMLLYSIHHLSRKLNTNIEPSYLYEK